MSKKATNTKKAVTPPLPEGPTRFIYINTGGISTKAQYAEHKVLMYHC